MAKSTFNPNMQPDFTPMSENPMGDSLDVFGKATREPRVSSLREQVDQMNANKTPEQKFWDDNARKAGYNVNDAQFRNVEIQKLRERIAKGQAGASDISGYSDRMGFKYKDNNSVNNQLGSLLTGAAQNLKNEVINTELAARVDQYIAIVKSKDSIDQEARQELMEMYRSGARSVDIAKKLKEAVDGVGIYGERKNNAAQAKLSFDRRVGDSRMGIL